MVTYVAIPDGQWRWTAGTPKIYRSSPGVERSFCGDCGTPLTFRSTTMSDVMHFYLAALEDPGALSPSLHVAIEEKLDWLKLDDGLPGSEGPDYTKV